MAKKIMALLTVLILTASFALAEGAVTAGSVEDRGFVLDNMLHDEVRGDIHGFVTANDFTGKTVIPFCTSQASGYGESGERLAAKAGTGNWIVGGNFFGEATDEEIAEWLGGLEK